MQEIDINKAGSVMNKMTKKAMLMIGLLFTAQSASAAYFSSFIYEMMSDESFIAKPVRNDTKTSNMYEVKSLKLISLAKMENIIFRRKVVIWFIHQPS